MRTLTKALFGFGFGLVAGAATLTLAGTTPAEAQGFYIDGPGIHVGVGERHHRGDSRDYREYREHRRGYGAYAADPVHPYGYRHNYGVAGCPFNYTVQDGVCKPYTGR
jgi:hypothetical protein